MKYVITSIGLSGLLPVCGCSQADYHAHVSFNNIDKKYFILDPILFVVVDPEIDTSLFSDLNLPMQPGPPIWLPYQFSETMPMKAIL